MLKAIYNRVMESKTIFFLISALLIIVYLCQLLIPYIFSGFIDEITETTSTNITIEPVVFILVLTVLLMVSSYLHHIISEVFITKTAFKFLIDVDYKLEHIPLRKSEKYNPAYLNNRIFNDILTTLGFFINNFIVAIIMFVSTIVVFILIIKINLLLVLIPVIAMAINIVGIKLLNQPFYKRGYQYREQNSQYISDNNDLITQIKETKIHSWYDISTERVEFSFKKLLKTGISLNKILAALNNIGTFSKNITLVLTMLLGGILILNQTITIGEFILITLYTNMCLSYSEYFLKLGQEYQHAKISFDRLEEIFDIEDEKNGEINLDKINKIRVEGLKFAYPDSDILFSDFSYDFEEGKIYCLKGKNGEGKSTFIDLLLGLDFNFEGSIKFNSSDIRKLDMRDLRKNQVSVIVQEPRLQRLSVKDNITRGIEEHSEESLNELVNIFGLQEIIGLEESLSLSGGEKQKVAIVREFLKKSSLIILDEPISALDTKSISVLKEELTKRKSNTIIILISHNEEMFDIIDEFIDLPKPLNIY
ncbi:MAG: ATP-binding cassette domain-containing protein [Bacillota bacterium]